ncbi:MAG: aminopeptidase P family protein [Holosporaceae bacterium]|jgi:Xaa-Pro aminopeptidase|nr:aminopeptidase P family protein [Holosporaceae bacterium]
MDIKNFLKQNALHVLMHRKSSKYPGLNDESNNIIQLTTGLASSEGAILISPDKSALFVDGRYLLSAKSSVDQKKFEILDLRKQKIVEWIRKNIPPHGRIAYDQEFYTHCDMDFFKDRLNHYDFIAVNLREVFGVAIPRQTLRIQALKDVKTSEEKIEAAQKMIGDNGLAAYLICDPCTVAWLLNIRDFSRKYVPVVKGYLLITKDRSSTLYVDASYEVDFSQYSMKSENDLQKDLDELNCVGIDKNETPSHLKHENFVHLRNPFALAKAVKNSYEIEQLKEAAQKDSRAIINFLLWFHSNAGQISELEAAEKILHFRRLQDGFRGESFETIAAADEHAAMIHYSPSAASNKIVQNILLVDSGGQYVGGTTDVTRTVCLRNPTEEQKLFYTLVLKGHIALANAKFPVGTTGAQLDSLARQFLWQYSSDYSHSTGHGIGYALNVHEGPCAISSHNETPLQTGMVLSNEPGYYRGNSFGIRLENMMVVRTEPDGFLSFETISLVPFDAKFIRKEMLGAEEISWLKAYNKKTIASLELKGDTLMWLNRYVESFI